MKLTVTQDFNAPPEAVFDRIADFAHFEDRARERGADVLPLTTPERLGWRVLFHWHGIHHELDLTIEEYERPSGYVVGIDGGAIAGTGEMALSPLGNGSTRLDSTFDLRATSLGGRLVMQTLGFARPALEARLKRKLEQLAAELDGRP